MGKLLTTRTAIAEKERATQLNLQEELDRTKRDLERMTAKAKMVSSGVASTGKEIELQEERNKLMVRLLFDPRPLRTATDFPFFPFFSGHSPMLDLLPSTSFTLHYKVHAQ